MAALKIAISGYYGCGNTGDEAVLAGIYESFRLRAVEAEFTVLSADPSDTEQRHGLRAIPRMDRAAMKRTFRESDLVLSGGGSLLQDTTSLRSLLYYLWVVRLAQKCGAQVMFYAQGIGPLRRPIARMLTRIVADRVRRITVRDPESAELLRRIGVRKPPIEVTADPAFALQTAPDSVVSQIIAEAGGELNGRYIGFALRPWHAGPGEGVLAKIAADIGNRTGRKLLFLPMQPPGDLELANSVAAPLGEKGLVVGRQLSPPEAAGVVANLDLLVGMRLHALIFAAAAGVPAIGLAYDPKVTQLMELTGQRDWCVPIDRISPECVCSAVESALLKHELLRSDLLDRSSMLREKALSNVDHALLAIGQRL